MVERLNAHISFSLKLGLNANREGAALLRGQGDTVASHLKLRAGEQALARAGNIANHLVVAIPTEAAELVLQQI